MAKPRSFFEPWTARAQFIPTPAQGPPPDDNVDPLWPTLWSAYERAVASADWNVWGSAMIEPAACTGLDGTITVLPPDRPVAHIGSLVTDHDDGPSKQDVARRIAACVNACRGLIDPEKAVVESRRLLLDLCNGRATLDDSRVVRCLALLSPPPSGVREEP